MRGRNCSKKQGMEVDKNLDKLKEEEEQEEQPHLSGAYIRSLVKQLTSSRTKGTHGDGDGDEDGGGLLSGNRHQNVTKNGKQEQNQPPAHHHQQQQQEQETLPPPPQQQHKKQVRRRLHTSRPYQERLLNMAEARREIVTALKFHRASMKQANTENPQSQTLQPPPAAPPLAQSPLEQVKLKSRRNPRIYASTATNAAPNFPNYRDNLSYSSLYSPSPNPPPYWVMPPVAPPPPILENFNLNLPNQTLGLNLNFQDFSNLDTTLYHNSYFSPSPISVDQEIPSYVEMSPEEEGEPCLVDSGTGSSFMNIEGGGGDQSGLHQAMDDEEMAEIRSLGEQHQMEWNDKMNLVTSAWWFKFLKNVEIGPEENGEIDDGFHPLIDQVMEFPDWISNANESCLQQQLDDHCSDDYLQDPALPCMDIGEIEGMCEEWLA